MSTWDKFVPKFIAHHLIALIRQESVLSTGVITTIAQVHVRSRFPHHFRQTQECGVQALLEVGKRQQRLFRNVKEFRDVVNVPVEEEEAKGRRGKLIGTHLQFG